MRNEPIIPEHRIPMCRHALCDKGYCERAAIEPGWSYTVSMPDGSKWEVDVGLIAWSHATHYSSKYGGDVCRSLHAGTIPHFESDPENINTWASVAMSWAEVSDLAKMVHPPTETDYEEGWNSGDWSVS